MRLNVPGPRRPGHSFVYEFAIDAYNITYNIRPASAQQTSIARTDSYDRQRPSHLRPRQSSCFKFVPAVPMGRGSPGDGGGGAAGGTAARDRR